MSTFLNILQFSADHETQIKYNEKKKKQKQKKKTSTTIENDNETP